MGLDEMERDGKVMRGMLLLNRDMMARDVKEREEMG